MTENSALPFGIDISKYQYSSDGKQKPNFDLINEKCDFVAVRAGISWGYTDPWFAYSWAHLDVPRLAYHVVYPGEYASKQMGHFLNIVNPQEHDRLVLDLELDHGYSKARITQTVNDCLAYILSNTGRYPVIYSRALWVDEHLAVGDLPQIDWWLAQYRKRLPAPLYTPELNPPPNLPIGVNKWLIHQTGERGNGGQVGVRSYYVDTNRFNGTRDEMKAWFGAAINEPEPIPEPPFPPVDQYPAGLLRVELWSQHDPRWGNDRMGESGVTLAQQGCLAVVTAIYLAYLGVDTDPKRYNALLGSRGGYQYNVKNGVKYAAMYWKYPGVLWPDKIAEDLSDYVWHSTGSGWEGRARRILGSGRPVLAMVDLKPGGEINQHWVLIVGERSDGWWAVDPETGTLIHLSKYQNKVYRIVSYGRRN